MSVELTPDTCECGKTPSKGLGEKGEYRVFCSESDGGCRKSTEYLPTMNKATESWQDNVFRKFMRQE